VLKAGEVLMVLQSEKCMLLMENRLLTTKFELPGSGMGGFVRKPLGIVSGQIAIRAP